MSNDQDRAEKLWKNSTQLKHLDASRNIENLGLLVEQLAYRSGFRDRVSLRAYLASCAVRR
jgi:hypothetical protein